MPDTATLENYAAVQAIAHGIPVDYFMRFITKESSWNPNAISPKGAEGIAQIMPETAAGHVNPFDPVASISWAAQTIAGYFGQFGSWENAFAAYNAGPGAVKQYGGVPPYPETRNYVDYILGKVSNLVYPTGAQTVTPQSKNLAKIVVWTAALILIVIGIRSTLK